ncbi:MAG: hypothetical protein ONB16_12615 [candidate division KSB1 bacterium]|nr:hypothetical protein [candidate division KSB1 bacterium]
MGPSFLWAEVTGFYKLLNLEVMAAISLNFDITLLNSSTRR